jgi:aromatic ring-opening dioxygenase LigB subunit
MINNSWSLLSNEWQSDNQLKPHVCHTAYGQSQLCRCVTSSISQGSKSRVLHSWFDITILKFLMSFEQGR